LVNEASTRLFIDFHFVKLNGIAKRRPLLFANLLDDNAQDGHHSEQECHSLNLSVCHTVEPAAPALFEDTLVVDARKSQSEGGEQTCQNVEVFPVLEVEIELPH
jgi:hypothetical protein